MQSTFEEKARIVCHGNCQFMAHTIITTSSKLFMIFLNIIFPFVLNGMVIPISNFQHHRIDDVENF